MMYFPRIGRFLLDSGSFSAGKPKKFATTRAPPLGKIESAWEPCAINLRGLWKLENAIQNPQPYSTSELEQHYHRGKLA